MIARGRRPFRVALALFAWASAAPAEPPPRQVAEAVASRYQAGAALLDEERWTEAAEAFDDVVRAGGSQVEGALYWKAYALHQAGRGEEATAVVDQLRDRFPGSPWLDDARSLQAELELEASLRKESASETPETLLLRGLSGLLHTNQERVADRLIELLEGEPTLEVQEQGISLLAQCTTPRSREALDRYVRGVEGRVLQEHAVRALGVMGGEENRALLEGAYRGSSDARLKSEILQAYQIARDAGRLFRAARDESDPELRRQAVSRLGTSGAASELLRLFDSVQGLEAKQDLVSALAVTRDPDALAQLARDSGEPLGIRRDAVRRLASHRGMDVDAQDRALSALYGAVSDVVIRAIVIEGLVTRGRDRAVIEIAHRETDPALRQYALAGLVRLGTPPAIEYLRTAGADGAQP